MNLADQIEETADRAVADLVAARAAHARQTRRDDRDEPLDGVVSDGVVSDEAVG